MMYNVSLKEQNTQKQITLKQTNQSFNVKIPQPSSNPPGGSECKNGVTFYPHVSDDGILSWTNDGGLPNPKPIKIRGKDGKTPVEGIDYFTEDDKSEMVSAVIAALPVYNGEVMVV